MPVDDGLFVFGYSPFAEQRDELIREQRRLLANQPEISPSTYDYNQPFADLADDVSRWASDVSLYLPHSQLQIDWDRYVTFADCAPDLPRSPTPPPLLTALNRPLGYPLTRHASLDETVPPTRSQRRPYAPKAFDGHPRQYRAELRRKQRDRLRASPLHTTHQGRSILALPSLHWYCAPSGFAVTQFELEDSIWRANDLANYLCWLDCGIRVHRSTTFQLLCVENIDVLNDVLLAHGGDAIVVWPTPTDWKERWGGTRTSMKGLPIFLRADYARKNKLGSLLEGAPPPTPFLTQHQKGSFDVFPKCPEQAEIIAINEDAGEAAAAFGSPQGKASQAAAARGQQDGDRLLHGVDAERAGEDADAESGWRDGNGTHSYPIPRDIPF